MPGIGFFADRKPKKAAKPVDDSEAAAGPASNFAEDADAGFDFGAIGDVDFAFDDSFLNDTFDAASTQGGADWNIDKPLPTATQDGSSQNAAGGGMSAPASGGSQAASGNATDGGGLKLFASRRKTNTSSATPQPNDNSTHIGNGNESSSCSIQKANVDHKTPSAPTETAPMAAPSSTPRQTAKPMIDRPRKSAPRPPPPSRKQATGQPQHDDNSENDQSQNDDPNEQSSAVAPSSASQTPRCDTAIVPKAAPGVRVFSVLEPSDFTRVLPPPPKTSKTTDSAAPTNSAPKVVPRQKVPLFHSGAANATPTADKDQKEPRSRETQSRNPPTLKQSSPHVINRGTSTTPCIPPRRPPLATPHKSFITPSKSDSYRNATNRKASKTYANAITPDPQQDVDHRPLADHHPNANRVDSPVAQASPIGQQRQQTDQQHGKKDQQGQGQDDDEDFLDNFASEFEILSSKCLADLSDCRDMDQYINQQLTQLNVAFAKAHSNNLYRYHQLINMFAELEQQIRDNAHLIQTTEAQLLQSKQGNALVKECDALLNDEGHEWDTEAFIRDLNEQIANCEESTAFPIADETKDDMDCASSQNDDVDQQATPLPHKPAQSPAGSHDSTTVAEAGEVDRNQLDTQSSESNRADSPILETAPDPCDEYVPPKDEASNDAAALQVQADPSTSASTSASASVANAGVGDDNEIDIDGDAGRILREEITAPTSQVDPTEVAESAREDWTIPTEMQIEPVSKEAALSKASAENVASEIASGIISQDNAKVLSEDASQNPSQEGTSAKHTASQDELPDDEKDLECSHATEPASPIAENKATASESKGGESNGAPAQPMDCDP